MKNFVLIIWLLISICSFNLKKNSIKKIRDTFKLDDNLYSYNIFINEFSSEAEIDNNKNMKIDISVSNLKDLTNDKIPINISWIKVIKFFQKELDKIKKFLQLRYEYFIFVFKKLIRTYNKFESCPEVVSTLELKGTIANFETDCVAVNISDIPGLTVMGKFRIVTSGTVNFNLELKLTVDFLPYDDDKQLNIYDRLKAVGRFIKEYNKLFMVFNQTSIYEALKTKLFNINFGYNDLIKIVTQLKKNNTKKYRRLQAGNRLISLIILFYESYPSYSKINSPFIDEEYINLRLENLKMESQKCGQILFLVKPEFSARETDTDLKNERMAMYLDKAGEFGNRPLLSLCCVIASNYYSAEGYSALAAVIDNLLVNGLISIESNEVQIYLENIDDNFVTDIIIQRLDLLIRSYTETNDEDSKKYLFSRRSAFMYRNIKMLKDIKHYECWRFGYDNLVGPLEPLLDYENLSLKDIDEFSKVIKKNIDDFTMKDFLEISLKCVEKFGLEIK